MASKDKKRPNIIFMLSDDQGAWAMGYAGNKHIITPNFNRLAAEGMIFTNSFCASPVCSPARATILTGRTPSQHGVQDWIRLGHYGENAIDYLKGYLTYPEVLKENGYECAFSGKWHLGDVFAVKNRFPDHTYVHLKGAGHYYNAPMAAKGEAGKALGVGIVFSFVGCMISLLALIFIAPAIAKVALEFSTFEYFSISVFSITLIGSLSGDNIWKGLLSGFLGILLSMVGMAPIDGLPRFTFGKTELMAGFDILPVLIDLFAVSELFILAEEKYKTTFVKPLDYKLKGFGFTFKEFWGQKWNALRSGVLGTAIGILPGIGGSVSCILSYILSKKCSKYPEKYGTGIIDGIVASETSNNAVTGGALIPLLTLGIPGDATTAMLLGALTLHGITPGPLLFSTSGDFVYGVFIALFVANIMMLLVEFLGLRVFVKLLNIPRIILMPIIIVLCVIGAFGLNNMVFDTVAIVIFGIIGYLLQKFKYPSAPMILGFILGPIIETNFRRSLMFSNGEIAPFFTNPISGAFLVLTFISILLTVIKTYKDSKKKKAMA